MIRLAALTLAVLAGPAGALERAAPRLCPENLPEGAHLPLQPGCRSTVHDKAPSRNDGFVDLGNGTSLRIGGRASAEYGGRR